MRSLSDSVLTTISIEGGQLVLTPSQIVQIEAAPGPATIRRTLPLADLRSFHLETGRQAEWLFLAAVAALGAGAALQAGWPFIGAVSAIVVVISLGLWELTATNTLYLAGPRVRIQVRERGWKRRDLHRFHEMLTNQPPTER